MTEPEQQPLRVTGVVYANGEPTEVEVEVQPGPLADALRAGMLRGLSVDLDDEQLAGELCGDPHPSARGRSCTEPAGHAGADLRGESHGDGRVDRWLRR